MFSKGTPLWFMLFGEYLIIAAFVACWAPPVFALFQVLRGQAFVGVATFVVWFPCFLWVVRECDRRQVIRAWLSIASTVLFLALVVVTILQK